MSKLKDLTGQRFGRLIVIKRTANDKYGRAIWECSCDCGNKKTVSGASLISGKVKSCGCLRHDNRSCVKHGGANTTLYRRWCSIIHRCESPCSPYYKNYGARGIKVCDEWHDFSKFKEWVIKTRPQEDYTVERIDVDGDYCPSNCTWIPLGEQARNRRTNVIIEYNGEKHILVEWCEILNLNYKLVHNRIYKLGWSFEQAISTPLDKSKRNKVERKSNGRIPKQSNTSG